jgi:hypothetical protein
MYFVLNGEYLFKVIEVSEADKRVKISFKAIRPELLRKIVPVETLSGFTNLKKKVEEEFVNYE